MIRSLELPGYRRLKVWLDELPPAEFVPEFVVSGSVQPTTLPVPTRRVAAIEFHVSHGPRSSYGLLGAELLPSEADSFVVSVCVNDTGPLYQQAISSPAEEVRVGLPAEYADAVLMGILKMAEARGAPAKYSLCVRWSAHGIVGSSPAIFEKISGALLLSLILPKDPSDEQIESIMR